MNSAITTVAARRESGRIKVINETTYFLYSKILTHSTKGDFFVKAAVKLSIHAFNGLSKLFLGLLSSILKQVVLRLFFFTSCPWPYHADTEIVP